MDTPATLFVARDRIAKFIVIAERPCKPQIDRVEHD